MNATHEQVGAEDSIFGKVISAYTRKQAIEDGVLVDATETAKEAGFRWPLAMTREVWNLIENIPEKYSHEDVQGRLWDILMVAKAIIQAGRDGQDILVFEVILHHDRGSRVKLKLHVGPGDSGEPVLTLMLPDQD